MSKKIALILIMTLIVNSFTWASSGTQDEEDGAMGTVLVILALVGLAAVLIGAALAEADAPDDGIRMVSAKDDADKSKTSFNSFVNFLSHLELGITQNEKIYTGFRISF